MMPVVPAGRTVAPPPAGSYAGAAASMRTAASAAAGRFSQGVAPPADGGMDAEGTTGAAAAAAAAVMTAGNAGAGAAAATAPSRAAAPAAAAAGAEAPAAAAAVGAGAPAGAAAATPSRAAARAGAGAASAAAAAGAQALTARAEQVVWTAVHTHATQLAGRGVAHSYLNFVEARAGRPLTPACVLEEQPAAASGVAAAAPATPAGADAPVPAAPAGAAAAAPAAPVGPAPSSPALAGQEQQDAAGQADGGNASPAPRDGAQRAAHPPDRAEYAEAESGGQDAGPSEMETEAQRNAPKRGARTDGVDPDAAARGAMDETAGGGFATDSSLAPPPADDQGGHWTTVGTRGRAKKVRPDPSPPRGGGDAAPAHSTRSRSAAGEHGRA
jgi:hypothetical protein